MERSAIDQLCNIGTRIVESTTTASVGTAVVSPMGGAATVTPVPAAVKPKKPKLSDLLKQKKLQQETDGTKPVIPANAELDKVANQNLSSPNAHTTPGAIPHGQLEEPIKTSVALVAPDTTPDAEVPLDPSQVPQPAVQTEPTSSSPTPVDNGSDVMRTLIGIQQSNFNPKAMVSPTQAQEALNKALNGETGLMQEGQKSAAEAKAAVKAAEVMNAANSGQNVKPHHNPESMNRAIAVTRLFME